MFTLSMYLRNNTLETFDLSYEKIYRMIKVYKEHKNHMK